MAQYLLSVWHDGTYEVSFEGEDIQRLVAQVDVLNQELQAAGAWVFAAGLNPAETATVVRAGADGVSMADGPYSDTDKQMGGFWVIEAPDRETALEWGRKAAAACEGPVEVRPFQS